VLRKGRHRQRICCACNGLFAAQGCSYRDRVRRLPFGDDVHRVHDPRNVTQQGQQNIQPERPAKPHLQKHAQRWQKNGDDDANKVHASLS